MWGDHMMFGGYMWLFWFLILVGIVLLVFWLSRQNRPTESKKSEDALEILKKRYARGEIDREDFMERKKDLLS